MVGQTVGRTKVCRRTAIRAASLRRTALSAKGGRGLRRVGTTAGREAGTAIAALANSSCRKGLRTRSEGCDGGRVGAWVILP